MAPDPGRAPSSGEGSTLRARLAPTALLLGCAFASLAPAFVHANLLADRYDWRYFDAMIEIARRSIAWYHEAPLWNPYSCGGEVDLANPQSLEASPGFLLVLAFGSALGVKLLLAAHLFFAMDGTRRLARRLGISPTGGLLAALGYGLSGYMALHFSEGHMTFIGVTLYPYLLYFYDRALDELEWAIPCGLVAAWIVLLGGTFTPPMAAELLVLWAAMAAFRRRSARPFALLVLAGVLALAASAVRMLPVLEFIHDHPRPPFMRQADASPPWFILWDLIAWREFGPLAFRKYWSHEYTSKLPYGLLPLWAAMVFWLAWSKRLDPSVRWTARRLWAVAILGVLFTMGNFKIPLIPSFAPWTLVQQLPVLRDLRVPSRHEVLIVLGLALLAGAGWDHAVRWASARWPGREAQLRRLGLALIAACAVDGVAFQIQTWRGCEYTGCHPMFAVYLNVPTPPVPFYQDPSGDWLTMRSHLYAGHGSLGKDGHGCDEEAPLQVAEALDPGEVPQERLLDSAAGRVLDSTWSPNRRVVTVELQRPTVLLVNSNWNEHWKTDLGTLTRVAGRLAVDLAGLPPGRHTITLRYAPRSFTVGALLSGLGLPAMLLAFVLRPAPSTLSFPKRRPPLRGRGGSRPRRSRGCRR